MEGWKTHRKSGINILSDWSFILKQSRDNAAQQQAISLSVCGRKTYELVTNLTMPKKPSDKTFKEIRGLQQWYKGSSLTLNFESLARQLLHIWLNCKRFRNIVTFDRPKVPLTDQKYP